MNPLLIGGGAAFLLWLGAEFKTSRPDGDYIKGVHPFRRLMQYIMPTRNESVVYFDNYIDAENLTKYLAEAKEKFDVDITHAIVGAATVGIWENPKMNQFIAGRRLYQRKGLQITFSMKRKRMDREAKLSAVKLEMPVGETFRELVDRINAEINIERSGKKTHADKEFDILNVLPRPVLLGAVKLLRGLDFHNVLPGFFIKTDGMYTSMFIANLGSLKMGAGFHHLYEWGNCPLFMMVGQLEDKPVVRDGKVVVRPIMHLRWSYDERIDDGLGARHGMDSVKRALEDPYKYLGCLKDDGSDARALNAPADS